METNRGPRESAQRTVAESSREEEQGTESGDTWTTQELTVKIDADGKVIDISK